MNEENEKRKLQLQALQKLRDKRLNEAQKARISTPDRSVNLAQGSLDKDVLKASGGSTGADLTEPVTRVSGADKIDTKQVQKKTDIGDFSKRAKDLDLKQNLRSSFKAAVDAGDTQMMNKLRKVASRFAKTGVKSIPLIGGVAAAALGGAEDASAAIPILDTADNVGMSSADENQMLSETEAKMNYKDSQAKKDRRLALAKLAKSGQ